MSRRVDPPWRSSSRPTPTTGWPRWASWPRRCPVAWSTAPSARRATRRCRPWSRPCRSSGSERGYPASAGSPALHRGRRRLVGAPLRAAGGPAGLGGGLRGHQGAGGLGAPVPAPAPARARHRAVPGRVLPDLRHGRRAGRLPGRAGAAAAGPARAASTSRPSPSPTPPGPWCCGRTRPPTRPGGLGDLGGRGGVGPGPRRAGVLRRVLRRVHLGRPAPLDPPARLRRRGGGPLALQALEPGRGAGRASSPATPSWSSSCAACASTPA